MEQVGVKEFTYNRDQILEMTRIRKCNRRLSAALGVTLWSGIFPKGTDPILILELLERVDDVLAGTNSFEPFSQWVKEA